jgi:hypothetical protein
MKNLHERLTKNLGKRLLMGVFFIFLGMIPAIYIWSTVPNHNKPPTPIPPSPTPMSVNNIEFNTNNDYLYDYSPPRAGTKNFKNNQYISLKDNQYIYYDNKNKIDFINSDNKIIQIENQKIIKTIGEFNSKDVIILNSNDIFKIGLVDDKKIEYINISKFELDFSKPIFISQSSETTFNLIYTDKNNFISLLQFDTLTNIFYNHNLIYQNQKVKNINDISYQNGIIAITVYSQQVKEEEKEINGNDINLKLITSVPIGTKISGTDRNTYLKLIENDTWYLYKNNIEDENSYSNKAVIDFLKQSNKLIFDYQKTDIKKIFTISNNEIINNNSDIVINENDIYKINNTDEIGDFQFANINFKPYDYEKIDKEKIKLLGLYSTGNIIFKIKVFEKNNIVFQITLPMGGYKKYANIYHNYLISLNKSNKTNKIFYFGDLITDNYNYLIYDNENCYISISENNLYIIDYTNGYLNIKYYDVFSKKIINKEFKNIKDLKLNKYEINFNNFFVYQNTYFNFYDDPNNGGKSILKIFTNESNIANIHITNIDKYKITRYKNNLVVLTKDKCLLLNLDSKNTTEFDLKDFDFDNYNSEFINANFDKNNILFKNKDTVSLFIFKI